MFETLVVFILISQINQKAGRDFLLNIESTQIGLLCILNINIKYFAFDNEEKHIFKKFLNILHRIILFEIL